MAQIVYKWKIMLQLMTSNPNYIRHSGEEKILTVSHAYFPHLLTFLPCYSLTGRWGRHACPSMWKNKELPWPSLSLESTSILIIQTAMQVRDITISPSFRFISFQHCTNFVFFQLFCSVKYFIA